MSFCKEQKKSAAFATDLFGRGRRTLSPRSTLVGQDGSTVPKGTVFTAVLFSSFCKKQRKNRLLLQPTFLAGAEGLEPSTKVLETHVLPLHHAPMRFVRACRNEI